MHKIEKATKQTKQIMKNKSRKIGTTGGTFKEDHNQLSPLFIPETLCNIFEYLNIRSLKRCRAVCSFWNFYAPSELAKRKRNEIRIHSQTDLETFLGDFIGEDGRLKGATKLISKISLNLVLPIDTAIFFSLIPKEEKYHKLLVQFFTKLGGFIKNLTLFSPESITFNKLTSLVFYNTPNLIKLNLRGTKITRLDSVSQDYVIPLKHLKKISIPEIHFPEHTLQSYYDIWTSVCPNVESFGCDAINEESSSCLNRILIEKNMISKLTQIPPPVNRNNNRLIDLKNYEALSLIWARLNRDDFNDILSHNEGTLKSLQIIEARSLFGIFQLPVLKNLKKLKLLVGFRFIRDLNFALSFPNLMILKLKIPKEFNYDPIYDALNKPEPLTTVTQLEISECGIHSNMNIFVFSKIRFPNVKIFKLFSNGIQLFREIRALWRTWKENLEELTIDISPDLSEQKRHSIYEEHEDYERYFDGILTGYDEADLKILNRQVRQTGIFNEPAGTKYTYPSTYFPLTIRNMKNLRKLTLRGILGFQYPYISFKTISFCSSLEEITIKTLTKPNIPQKAMDILKRSVQDVYYV